MIRDLNALLGDALTLFAAITAGALVGAVLRFMEGGVA